MDVWLTSKIKTAIAICNGPTRSLSRIVFIGWEVSIDSKNTLRPDF
jgi:hypothetical protein